MKKGMVVGVLVLLGLLGLPLLVWMRGGPQPPISRANGSTDDVSDRPVAGAVQPAAVFDRLYLFESYDRVAVVNATSGEREQSLPALAFAPDGATAYTVEFDGRVTQVRALDVASGTRLGESSVAGRYDWPRIGPTPVGLSPNGRWLALQSVPYGEDENPRSRFVVLDTAFKETPRQVELPGVFEFDALANDGSSLYLIDYGDVWQATGIYQVRRYDLRQGALDPAIIADKRNPDETMVGTRQAAVASPDGAWLYSLYVDFASGKVFIHALNLDGAFAICIDLPARASQGEGDLAGQMWGLARSPDGHTLYAANGWLGKVIEVDADLLVVGRTAELELPQAKGGNVVSRLIGWLAPSAWAKIAVVNPVAVAPDGGMLYTLARQGVVAVDTATLTVHNHYLDGHVLTSLGLNRTGDRAYALEVDSYQVLGLDLTTGEAQVEMEGDHLWWGLLRVETAPVSSAVPATCPVTLPSGSPFTPPAPYPPTAPDAGTFWYGTRALWTALPDAGRWGQLSRGEKVFWWSEAFAGEPQPDLVVTGRRLDAETGSLEASPATNAFHDSFERAMLTGVQVSDPGCWEIKARYHGQELTWVVWVAP